MDDDLCYMFVSKGNMGDMRLHGIFTTEYMIKHKYTIKELRDDLKEHTDFQKCYIIPINHLIEKGMMI